MADIFISYKREDQEEHGRVKPIADALRAEGYDVFYDVQVPPGSKWEDVLEGKIADARAVLVLWSSASVGSDWVKEEAEMAKAAGKLIPVTLDPVSPPFGFARIESANLADWDGDLTNIEWKNLVAAVKARIGEGERVVQPEVTAVAYPRKSVTVTKQRGTGSGGRRGVGGLVIGLCLLALVAGGFIVLQLLDDRPAPTSVTVSEAADAAMEATGGVAVGAPSVDPDDRDWATAQRADTIAAYERYLDRQPSGQNRSRALSRIMALRDRDAGAAAPRNYDGISERTYRVAGVTLSKIELSPAPPAQIVEGENISITFNYQLNSARTARVWARPVNSGTGACSFGASGAPELTGSGRGNQRFSMNGSGCSNHTITGIRFSVQPDDNRDRADDIIVPVEYTFR